MDKNQKTAKILNTAGIILAILAVLAAAGIFLTIFFPVLILILLAVAAFQVARYFQTKPM